MIKIPSLRGAAAALAAFFLCLAVLAAAPGALALGRVFPEGEAEPFAEGAEVLTLYVAPIMGADCMLLNFGDEWLLVDSGKESDARYVVPMLESLGVTRIQRALNTHPHVDHIGAMRELAARFPFGSFLTAFPPDYEGRAVKQESVIRRMKQLGVPVVTVRDGDTLTLGKAEVLLLRQDGPDANAMSVALRVTYGETSMLLAADLTALSQTRLAARYDLKSDVLKYPHHGLENPGQGFLDEVAPEFAFITNGSLGSRLAWERLEKAEIPYAFTTWGMIVVRSDGERILVSQDLSEKGQGYREAWIRDGKDGIL